MQSRCCWPPERPSADSFSRSLTSSQSAAWCSARSTRSSRLAFQAEHARPEGDVVVDRLRKRVRLLEDHPDPAPHLDRVDVARVEVLAVVEDLAVDLRAGHEVVHPVEAADQRALAAPARADEGGHGVLEDVDADVPNRDVATVRDREVADLEDGLAVRDALIAVVGELAELAGDEVRGLLADVDGVVADPLEAARDEDHPQPPLPLLELVPDVEQPVDDPPVRAVDQLVELEQRLGRDPVALLERAERDADHLLGPLAHLA